MSADRTDSGLVPPMKISEFVRALVLPWRWPRRRACHGSIWCCQYVDRPNDNHGRWGLR